MRPFLLLVFVLCLASRGEAQELPPVPAPPADPTPLSPPPADPTVVPPPPADSTASSPEPPPSFAPAAQEPFVVPRYAPRVVLRRDLGETLWLPQLSWAVASTSSPQGDGGIGSRVQLTIPVWVFGERGDLVRWSPLVGYSWTRGYPGGRYQTGIGYTGTRIDSDVPDFHRHHVLLGAALRLGRRPIGWQSELFWSPGTFGSWDCHPHPMPDPEIHEHVFCQSIRGPTAASFRAASGITAWNAFVGWTAEVAWRNGQRARSLGIRIGTTFH
ncbi:MAG: hypothetical protein H6720_19215 [Sandaracinus sp.]|nr:hypothetical protein [Sandaracinus sp.]